MAFLDETGLAELWDCINDKYGMALMQQGSRVTLGSFAEGSLITLNESGLPVEFYVAKHNYESGLNGTGRTLLVRKDCYDQRAWNSSNVNAWGSCSLLSWLNGDYLNMLDADIRAVIGTTKYYYTQGNGDNTVTTRSDAVFQLSATEFGFTYSHLNTEGSALPIASTLRIANYKGSAAHQWTRSPYSQNSTNAVYLWSTGDTGHTSCTSTSCGSRPAFTLPSDFVLSATFPITDILGNPVLIPGDQIVGGVKIATGSYTGTGTYGKSNPNSLTFDFVPKVVYISENSDFGANLMMVNGQSKHGGMYYSDELRVQATWLGNTFTWYTTESEVGDQLNTSGTTYYYFAIG